jgi:phosphatidylglycerol---prolipoprotein diacylglyceryl transferase
MNLLAYLNWGPDKEIFIIDPFELFGLTIGPIAPRWYGLLFVLGFIIGYYILVWIFKSEKKNPKDLDALTMSLIIATVIGARLGHCLFYDPVFYLSNPIEILKVWQGGLASHGAAFGLLIALLLFVKKHKEYNFIWLSDRIVIGISLAACLVRLGNFINSEILGKAADVPWAVVFYTIDDVPRHPSQLYEAITYFTLFLFLLLRYQNKKSNIPKGELTGIFLTVLFSARFLIEFTKEVQSVWEEGMPLDMGQILSIPLIALGIFFLYLSRTKWKNK